MSQRRVWVGGAALVTVFLVIVSYLLLIHPKMSEADSYRAQRVSTQQSNDQLRLNIAQLKAEYATLPAKQAELAVVQQQLPASPNLPTLIRNMTSMANESGVTLNSIAPAAPVAATTTAGGPTTSGLYDIPVTLTVQGDFASNELFLQKVQTEMRRAFLVQTIGIGKAPAAASDPSGTVPNGEIAVTLTGSVFVLQAVAPSTTTTTGSAGTTAATAGSPS
jgi:Tfp pilus assembly protein PilO